MAITVSHFILTTTTIPHLLSHGADIDIILHLKDNYIVSGDSYSRCYDEVVASFPQKTKCIDDTLLWSDTIHDCFFHVTQCLDICEKNGIIYLNMKKLLMLKML